MTASPERRNPAGGPGFEKAQAMGNGLRLQRSTAGAEVHP